MSPSILRQYRLRIRNANNSADALVLSSKAGEGHAFLSDAPDGDGQRVDVIRGSIEDGMYRVFAIDAEAGSTGGVLDAAGVVTAGLTDASGRYVLLGRRAFVERSDNGGGWTVLVAGYVEGLRLADASTYEFSIGDTLRIERTRQVFVRPTTAFPKIVSILTGGVPGGWMKDLILDRGAWRMRVVAPGFAGTDEVEMEFVNGQLPTTEGFRFASGTIDATAEARINSLSEPYRQPRDKTGSLRQWHFPGLVATLVPVAGGDTITRVPIASHPLAPGEAGTFRRPQNLIARNRLSFDWVDQVTGASVSAPSNGTLYDVTITPLEVSELAPLHIEGHPVDVLEDLWGEAGIAVDSATVVTVRAAIGSNRRIALRITGPRNLAEFQESVLFGPFGFGFREGGDGERELMVTRHRSSSTPAATIVETDVLSDEGSVFDLSEARLVRSVAFSQMRFVKWTTEYSAERPADDVLTFTEMRKMDADPMPERGEDIVYEIPGTIYSSIAPPSWNWLGAPDVVPDFAAFASAESRSILSRFSTGCPGGDLLVLDDVAPLLGEEVVLNLPYQVNGAVRGGERIVQVIGRTPTPAGTSLALLDAGADAQASSVPTFTITASATQPASLYSLAITNAATLAAAGYMVRIEFGIGGSAPSDGTLLAILDPASETTLRAPRVDAGSHVWVRMRSERADGRPSAWSSWSDVNLTDLVAPSSLTNSGNVLSWTVGETTFPEEVFWRLSSESAGANRRVAVLAAGAASFDLAGYVPAATEIVATVRTRDPFPFQGVSTSATVTYTTPALSALANLVGFVGFVETEGGHRTGVYGVEATQPTDFPSFISFEEAVETAVGSATYGSFEEVGVLPAKVGEAVRLTRFAQRDGKRRRLRARAVLEGRTASSYTVNIDLLPWGASVRAPIPRRNIPLTDDIGGPTPLVAYAARAENTAGTTLPASTVQTNGTTVRSLVKGHVGAEVRHGDIVDFVEDFADVPIVLFRNGVSSQPESKWGTAAEVDADDGSANDAPAATAQYDDFAALGLTTSGFTVRARLRQRGTPTLRTHDFAANDLDVEGEATAAVVLTNAPAGDDKYTVHFSVFLDLQSGPVEDSSLQIIVAAETRKDGGSWLEGASQPYSIAADGMGGTANQTWPHETLQVTVDDLDTDDEIRLILKSVELVGAGASITDVAVHGFVAADPDDGVTYTTETSPKFASKTPETDDRVHVHAMAVS